MIVQVPGVTPHGVAQQTVAQFRVQREIPLRKVLDDLLGFIHVCFLALVRVTGMRAPPCY